MPFTKLVKTHQCSQPTTRPDGSNLQVGDEWRCDEDVRTVENEQESFRTCGKQYRWHSDQREGLFWMPINYN